MEKFDIQWPGWEVTRLIGTGSFGSVYEIERNLYGNVEKAALKVIHIPQSRSDIEELYNDGFDDESITARFNGYLEDIIREYSMMASLKGNKNVVYCDDVRQIQHEDGIGWDIYIKMELLTPLVKTLGKEISEDQVIDIGIDMCSALVMCKEQNIVHRDIKPQNIFVSKDGVYKLGDFGIAKTAERTTSGTKTGTYKYMAPEVYKSMPYGAAADQYSLGMVLYWLLNERRTPFLPLPSKVKATTVTMEDEARKRRFDGEQIPPPAHGSNQLQAIVLKACAYDPKDRFASASEMLDALRAVKGGTAPSAMLFQSGSASSNGAGAAAVGAGVVAAGNVIAGEEDFTSRTVGRRPNTPDEEGTIGRNPNTQAYSGAGNNGQYNQQHNNNTVVSAAVQTQEEKKKKRGAAAWIAIAAGLVVLIAGIALLAGLGRDKDKGGSQTVDSSKTVDTTNIRMDVTETNGSETTTTEPGETLPIQLDWADWDENLPDYVTDENYDIEERTLYSFRNLETTSSTTSSSMDGWELYDTATGNGDYGAWSDWSKTAVSKSDTRDVETQTRYRYSDKETTTSSSSSKSGWTLDNTTYSWGDYGSWSQWSTDKAAKSDSRDVQTETRYRYREKETTTSSSSSMAGWTQYNVTTSWGDWGSWSSWQTDSVSANDGRQVDAKTQYRYRDKEYKSGVTDSNLSGWTRTNSYVVYGSWSSNKTTTSKPSESDTLRIVDQYVSGYNYFHYCCNYYDGGWMVDSIPYGNTNSTHYHTIHTTSQLPRLNMADKGGKQAYGGYGTGAPACANNFYAWFLNSTEYTYVYQTRTATTLYDYERWGQWSSWSDSAYTQSTTRQVDNRTLYRYRTRSQNSTYYFYRWKDWSSWSTTAVSGNDNRQVETEKFYRYRDRASMPTYHFSRWKDWSAWSTTAVSESSTRKVETKTFYRYRDRVTQTTYYFQRWTEWSDYAESPVEENSTTEVRTRIEYRYRSKG